jgi:hypothetical protein
MSTGRSYGGQNPGDPQQGGNPNYGNPNQGGRNPNYGDPNPGYPPPDYGDPGPGDYGQSPPPLPPPQNTCRSRRYEEKPTYLSLAKETRGVCDLVFETQGTVAQLHEKHTRESELLEQKQCLFKRTEGNYQRYRNFEMLVGTELLQFNDSVKTSVAAYGKTYKDLNDTLKNIAKGAKELKAKVTDLKDAGSKLYNCVNDDCHKTQRRALTGTAPGCEPVTPIPPCAEAGTILEELIYRPLGLLQDVDYIFKSAYEVVGIQTFSSVESLDALQKKLDEQSRKLGKQVSDTVKAREGELKKLNEEMVKAVQEVEKAWLDLNYQRSTFEGYNAAAQFLCDPQCGCPDPKEPEDYSNRHPLSRPLLKGCQERICELCEIVDNSFCCVPASVPVPYPEPHPPYQAT